MAKKLRSPWDGPLCNVVLATAPALSDAVPATLDEQMQLEDREVREEAKWTAELAKLVRAGSLSLETVIDVVALQVARRVRHQQLRDRKRAGYGW